MARPCTPPTDGSKLARIAVFLTIRRIECDAPRVASNLRPIGQRSESFVLIAASAGIVFGALARAVQMVTSLDGALGAGAAFGILSAALSYRKWRQVAWDTTSNDPPSFNARATAILTELRYETVSTTGSAVTFDRLGISKVNLASVASLSPGTLYRVTIVYGPANHVLVTGPQEVLLVLVARLAG